MRASSSRQPVNTAEKNEASAFSKLSLVYSPGSMDDRMNKANNHLAARQAYQALQVYNEILQPSCHSHPCALLNRSLAFLALGYPELAVTDAYRAAVICYGMRMPKNGASDKHLRIVSRYTRAEHLAKQSGAAWATEPTCYIGRAWLGVPLAAIFLHADQIRTESNQRLSVCMALEVKAIYRMAYALWKCGGGALSDALGLLSDAKARYRLTSEEEFCMISLGDEILFEIEEEMRREKGGAPSQRETQTQGEKDGLSSNINALRIQDVLRRRYTMVKREVYVWNKHEPDLEDDTMIQALNKQAGDIIDNSELRVMSSAKGKMPALALVSIKNTQPGDMILTEESSLQVTNCSAKQTGGVLCNACAASMVVPAMLTATGTGVDPHDMPLEISSLGSFPRPKTTSEGEELDIPHFSQKQALTGGGALTPPGTPPEPQPQQQLPSIPNLRACLGCGQAFFCSSRCETEAKNDYHLVLCGKDVESGICEAIQKHEALAHHPVKPEAEQIYELLLVRIFALAKMRNAHPLDLDEVRWLDGDFWKGPHLDSDGQVEDTGKPIDFCFSGSVHNASHKTLPWSFEANVVRPLKWLKKMGWRPIEDTAKCDGWIINTLLAKIMASTRITKGSRQAKVYDASGRLVTGLEAALREGPGIDADVCVGSIHPIFSHIQCVSDERDANVVVKDGEFVSCVARGGSNDIDYTSETNDTSIFINESGPEKDCAHTIQAGTRIRRYAETMTAATSTSRLAGGRIDAWIGAVADQDCSIVGSSAAQDLEHDLEMIDG